MKAILDNPYRIAGLLVGATAREQERQINKLKRYLEAGQKPPQDDYSFPVLGKLDRTLDTVEDVASKLHLDSDKMDAAIFWFCDSNTDAVDPAIEALKISGTLYASTIWSKKTTRVKITEDNCFAFQNFSTLLLCQSLRNKPVNKPFLEQGICMKLQFLDSDFLKELELKATDETYKTTKEAVQLSFLNILQREIEQSGEITATQWIDIISKYEFSAKEEYLNNYIQKLIEQIERKIETTQDRRGTEKANAADAGNELYGSTKDMLIQLQSLLGISNIKYSSVADKVANEILQCGIDYFNNQNEIPKEIIIAGLICRRDEDNEDFAKTTMNLFEKAKSLVVGNVIKQRIAENIDILQKQQYRIIEILKFIKEGYERMFEGIDKNVISGNYISIALMEPIRKRQDSITNEIIRKEITDEVLMKLATSNDQTRISEFYELLQECINKANNKETLLSIEFKFCEYLPKTSIIKSKILQKIETKKREEEEKKRREEEERQKFLEQQKKENEKAGIQGIIVVITMVILSILLSVWLESPIGIAGGIGLGWGIGIIISKIVLSVMD